MFSSPFPFKVCTQGVLKLIITFTESKKFTYSL